MLLLSILWSNWLILSNSLWLVQFLCTVVAILLHYFFMSSFAWLFVEALHIYRMQTEARNINYGAMRFYYAIGWGVPAIITGVYTHIHICVLSCRYALWHVCVLQAWQSGWIQRGMATQISAGSPCMISSCGALRDQLASSYWYYALQCVYVLFAIFKEFYTVCLCNSGSVF